MKKKQGLFITFEGTEGVGKSTLLRELQKILQTEGIPHLLTREPGGSAVAEKIRELILKNEMNPWTELFLYEAARSEHLYQTILPALQKGYLVLCDRFTDSTLAYQGHARGLPLKEIQKLNRIATQGLRPDLTFWMDGDAAQALKKATDPNRFEAEGESFQRKVREGFRRAKQLDPKRWRLIRAYSKPADQLAESAWNQIRIHPRLKKITRIL